MRLDAPRTANERRQTPSRGQSFCKAEPKGGAWCVQTHPTELVKEFHGLARTNLSTRANGHGLQHDVVEKFLIAMRENSTPVKPAALDAIGKDHIADHFASLGCVEDSFRYRKVTWTDEDGLPSIMEVAFGWRGADPEGLHEFVGWGKGDRSNSPAQAEQ